MNSNLSLELLSDLKSSYVLFSPLKSAKISLESIFSLLCGIRKASVALTLTLQMVSYSELTVSNSNIAGIEFVNCRYLEREIIIMPGGPDLHP